jgi:F-type H+-transporting ATPase subunit epsilon
MAYTFRIDILTPDETYFAGEVLSLMIPGAAWPFGVLLNHAPMVAPVSKGRVEMLMGDRTKRAYAIEGGFFEVAYNQATLLTEKITPLDLAPSEFRIGG